MTAPAENPPVDLYQIAYSPATLAEIEPGYGVLDNLENPRPDWFEYWPIRRFLLERTLDESTFYGFFSPKFRSKTSMSHAQVTDFVRRHATEADVLLFSPQPDMGAFFLNVFEQAEIFDRGFIDTFDAFLATVGRSVPLRQMVMDSRQTVFSNYFVARPAFWREWLALNEALFALCEGPETALRQQLLRPTSYDGVAQRKVFVMERVAPLLLATQPQWRTKAADPFGYGWSTTVFRNHPSEAFISDALKIAFREQGYPEYMQAYSQIRRRVTGRAPAPSAQT
jgi:hypothetical protein